MNILQANKAVFRRVLDFTGRSSRSEYWWSQLTAVLLAYLVLLPLMKVGPPWAVKIAMVLVAVYALPLLAVSFRRLQDTSISGMWMMAFVAAGIMGGLIQAFVWLLFLGLMCVASTDGRNQYGPSPLEPDGPAGEPDEDTEPASERLAEAVVAAPAAGPVLEDQPKPGLEPQPQPQYRAPRRTIGYTLSHVFDFTGRAPRHEFVGFFLVAMWGYLALVAVVYNQPSRLGVVLLYVYHYLFIFASLGLQVRRLHDMNLSGLWLLPSFLPAVLMLVPFLGQWLDPDFWASALSLLYFGCFAALAGTDGRNSFGADPLTSDTAADIAVEMQTTTAED
ncbi:DUF805 domain-containing protein [Kordiimonas lacus]|uniref:Uncharacterized membrane protein YhaH, DUF805 family n=1 Tax=Kordiimonas lacus TaxID=637679 RepID=A0A1G7F938_9PROT|nr:DUF805 domain-containing protein [Kordiimonas lacus]SDE72463.1 Uncharacterized membrane protein YhaH, DUF805 family [Kordiimonas lacus]